MITNFSQEFGNASSSGLPSVCFGRITTDAAALLTNTASATAGANTLTFSSATGFAVGDAIVVSGAGVAGAELFTRITAISVNTVTVTGTSIGTTVSGVAVRLLAKLDFPCRVRKFKIQSLTNNQSDEWQQGMPSRSSIRTVQAGTRSYATGNGITCTSMSVLLDPAVLAVSSEFIYEAVFN